MQNRNRRPKIIQGTLRQAQPHRFALKRQALTKYAVLCTALLSGFLAMPGIGQTQETVQIPIQKSGQAAPVHPETAAKPETGAQAQHTAGQPQTADTSGPAISDESGGLHLPAIADFAPGSVYSGTLGELTRLQAGQEMARATLSLKEIQARILEAENSMAKARRELNEQKAAEKAGSLSSLQEAMSELRAGLESLAEDVAALRLEKQKAQAKDQDCLVLSVRSCGPQGSEKSGGSGLMAEIATREGCFLAGAGDRVPGVGRIDKVTRTRVIAEGRPLPWK